MAMERLNNLNETMDDKFTSWELIEIYAEKTTSFLMIPQNHAEKILILGTSDDAYANLSLNKFVFDPKMMTEEQKSSLPEFKCHDVYFRSNQFNVSKDGKKITSIAQDYDEYYNLSNIFISFT